MPEHPHPLDVAIAALATFRVCRFTTSDGFPPMKRLREGIKARYGSDSSWTELATCPWCQSLWLSPLVVLSIKRYPGLRWLLLGPAISGVVGLLSTADSALGKVGGEILSTELEATEWNPAGPGVWRRSVGGRS